MKNKKKIILIIIAIIVYSVILITTTYLITNNQKKAEKTVNNTTESKNNTEKTEVKEVEELNEEINPKELIRITKVTTSTPNSAGGVDLNIEWQNVSDKVIKYITFTAYPVNAVNDIVYCTIRTSQLGQFKGKETGPFNKGEGSKKGYVFENAWYNNTIVKAIIMQIDIEYMDGTNISLSPSQVDEVIY